MSWLLGKKTSSKFGAVIETVTAGVLLPLPFSKVACCLNVSIAISVSFSWVFLNFAQLLPSESVQ